MNTQLVEISPNLSVQIVVMNKDEMPMPAQQEPEKELTKKQRRQAMVDAQRNKVTYDLPVWLTEAVSAMAKEGEYPASHLVALFMAYGIEAVNKGMINPDAFLVMANSPRFTYWLRFGEDDFEIGGVK